MKFKKGIMFIILLLLSMCCLSVFTQVNAASGTGSLYLNLTMVGRRSGYGYQIASGSKNVWKIYETGKNTDDTIYCLRGGPGFGSADYSAIRAPVETHYTKYFDLKDPDDIPAVYQAPLPDVNGTEYQALLWILDNCYVAPKIDASSTAKAEAKINRDTLLTAATNYAVEQGNPEITEFADMDLLTDDDIDAVQQLAVWYYTNPTGDYHVENIEFYVNIVQGVDANYKALSEDILENGWERALACQALFDYLVKTPQKAGFSYSPSDSSVNTVPVKLSDTSNITVQKVNNRYIVGPYKLEQVRDTQYSLDVFVNDENDNEITDVIYLDKNKNEIINMTDDKQLVGEEFYISVPSTNNIKSVKFNISGSYTETKLTYWSVIDKGNNNLELEQPVVKVEKITRNFSEEVVTDIPEEPTVEEFDLALRKFIISINGVAPAVDRTPVIDAQELEKLKNGTTTTARKVHPKDALAVKKGDKVVYKIRIYNEGNVNGYASTVIDYLPTGLKLADNSTINTQYGWKTTKDVGTAKTTYLADKMINKFDGTTLDFVDLEIECEVTAVVESKNQNLKNIAEITMHKDKDGNTEAEDRDSKPNNVDKNNYGTTSQEDDDDFEDLVVLGQYFDLSLRKFITEVTTGTKTKNYNRAPQVDVTDLKNETATTATYNHDKTPVSASNGDIVTYTIRIYNEGQLDGYVTEITDHLPEQLEFIVNDELNAKYGWTVSQDGRTVKTDITSLTTTSSANRDNIYAGRTNVDDKVLLKAFDGTTLDYIDVQIRCKVKENIDLYEKITNIAEITEFADQNGDKIIDRDSQKDNVVLPTDDTLPNYKDAEIDRGDTYIPGQQDDDDFEKLVIKRFDLALRKFITGVNDKEITSRAPVFTITENNEYKYVHSKEPVEVANGNTVVYTLRVFNEGNMAGYAEEVKDDLPEGLEYLPTNAINTAFRWKMYKQDGTETTEVKEASYIKTDYLAKINDIDNKNLLKAFDPETMTMPDYRDLKIAFKVTEPNTSDRVIINTAEITEDADEDGKEVEDVDSTPDNNNPDEDDQDIEKIKVKYFDLALKKWVTESIVTYNGKTTITKTGHTGDENPEPPAKVEIRSDRINQTTVKFKFSIKVTNEGEIEGYAKEIIDYIPQGLKFVQEDNPKWRLTDDGKVLTNQLKDVLIKPGESQTVEIILTWINGKNNMGLKTNWAEIYEDDNDYDSPDIDSTPGNDKKGEDDEDDAPVIITTATGSVQTYITLALVSVSIIAGGVILIKKIVIE